MTPLKRTTHSYDELMSQPLSEIRYAIEPGCSDGIDAHYEYGAEVADFTKVHATFLNRLIPTYNAEVGHGPDVYDAVVSMALKHGVSSVLDLGCGDGTLLSKFLQHGLTSEQLYGCTLHVGECIVAREKYGLYNVAPLDMKRLTDYYLPGSFDCILSVHGLSYMSMDKRLGVVRASYKLLPPNGLLAFQQYYADDRVKIPCLDDVKGEYIMSKHGVIYKVIKGVDHA